ncbi:unnamed protein product [Amoebophrya sp. A120]|nr:unnamed protein product [Amoebophrya sp. A120]|eukprot:GSA120T00014701001.1
MSRPIFKNILHLLAQLGGCGQIFSYLAVPGLAAASSSSRLGGYGRIGQDTWPNIYSYLPGPESSRHPEKEEEIKKFAQNAKRHYLGSAMLKRAAARWYERHHTAAGSALEAEDGTTSMSREEKKTASLRQEMEHALRKELSRKVSLAPTRVPPVAAANQDFHQGFLHTEDVARHRLPASQQLLRLGGFKCSANQADDRLNPEDRYRDHIRPRYARSGEGHTVHQYSETWLSQELLEKSIDENFSGKSTQNYTDPTDVEYQAGRRASASIEVDRTTAGTTPPVFHPGATSSTRGTTRHDQEQNDARLSFPSRPTNDPSSVLEASFPKYLHWVQASNQERVPVDEGSEALSLSERTKERMFGSKETPLASYYPKVFMRKTGLALGTLAKPDEDHLRLRHLRSHERGDSSQDHVYTTDFDLDNENFISRVKYEGRGRRGRLSHDDQCWEDIFADPRDPNT